MAITLRHDASAVALPSTNASGRKYGQQLVLQQQQQKYLGHQAGLDRLFDANKQASQNQFQWRRDQNQNQVQWARDLQRNSDIAARDQVQFDRQQEANRAAEFAQARDRIGMHAQEMLNSGEIPEHLRPEVRELIRGKSIILGSGFDETARKEYLSDYNARLAGILSQIPPKTPPPTPQETFDRSIVVDPKTGMRYRVDKDGNPEPLAQLEQPQQQPTSFGEWQQQEPEKARKAFADKAAAIQQSIDDGLLTLKNGQTVEDMVFEQLEQPFQAMRKRYGPPTPAPQLPGANQGAAPSSPMQSILETPAAPPAAAQPAQEQPPAGVAEAPLTPQEKPQNAWSEVASGGRESVPVAGNQRQPEIPPRGAQEGAKQGSKQDDGDLFDQVSGLPMVKKEDFGKLVDSAEDDSDKSVIRQVQKLANHPDYANSPDIVNALHVVVGSNSTKEDRLAAAEYLKAKGIDLEQAVPENPDRSDKLKKVHEKNQKRFGSSRQVFDVEW